MSYFNLEDNNNTNGDDAAYVYEAYTTSTGLRTGLATDAGPTDPLPTGGFGNTWLTLGAVLLALVFVLFLAYYATRFTGRGRSFQKTRNLRIVEVLGVNPQTTVQLIKAGDKCFVIGVSRNGVTALGEVDADSIQLDGELDAAAQNPFNKYLERFTKKKDEPAKDETG